MTFAQEEGLLDEVGALPKVKKTQVLPTVFALGTLLMEDSAIQIQIRFIRVDGALAGSTLDSGHGEDSGTGGVACI